MHIRYLAIIGLKFAAGEQQQIAFAVRSIYFYPAKEMKQYERCSAACRVMSDEKKPFHTIHSYFRAVRQRPVNIEF